jgi:hypothetical protein
VKIQPRDVVEDGVPAEERRADVDRRGRDPQVVGVDRLVQRMSDLSAGVTKLRSGGQ